MIIIVWDDSCISCGICTGVCPAKNITLEEGKPTFHHIASV
ncbi:4Fe-4S binding protein [Oscillospiraceae bacterium OttesenSCG-928-F05]|nr:4Fe-4S binding protein [Oscillospiraceae bacterium OttesenSCG-928-F05]